MKKFISILIAVLIFFSFQAFAEGENEKVEISFKVGDSTLLINGNSTTVETPYVAGEGHTLVPLRVITEAFGAKVDWDGNEKKIFLSYPDVDITLQIGNLSAQVNTHTETLPVAPVLSSNGVTMIPLRFISETFGADVTYDEATKAITVIKDSKGSSVSLSGTTDMPRVGDSYYNWSMDTPKEMFMYERSFDGTYTEYVSNNDDNNYICIYIEYMEENASFDKDFADEKSSLEGYTLLKADKLTDENNNKYMHFRIKDEYDYYDYKIYYTEHYEITIETNVTVDSDEIPYLQAISDSFRTSFTDKKETYDLSNVEEDGYRVYKNDKYKLSFKVPEYFYELTSNAKNEMSFYSLRPDDPGILKVALYSKNDGMTAEKLALKDYNNNKKYVNEDYVTFTDVGECVLNDDISGFGYTLEISGTKKQDAIHYDIFFEKGEYIYNISVASTPADKGIKTIIVPSVSARELKFEDTGILLRNDYEEDGTYKSSGTYLDLELPLLWEELVTPSASAMYIHKATASVFSVFSGPVKDVNTANMEEYVTDVMQEQIHSGAKSVKKLSKERIGDNTYYTYVLKQENDGITAYTHSYVAYLKGKVVVFSLSCDVLTYSEPLLDEFKSIIKTLTIK